MKHPRTAGFFQTPLPNSQPQGIRGRRAFKLQPRLVHALQHRSAFGAAALPFVEERFRTAMPGTPRIALSRGCSAIDLGGTCLFDQ
jgi:hypothetical protein